MEKSMDSDHKFHYHNASDRNKFGDENCPIIYYFLWFCFIWNVTKWEDMICFDCDWDCDCDCDCGSPHREAIFYLKMKLLTFIKQEMVIVYCHQSSVISHQLFHKVSNLKRNRFHILQKSICINAFAKCKWI